MFQFQWKVWFLIKWFYLLKLGVFQLHQNLLVQALQFSLLWTRLRTASSAQLCWSACLILWTHPSHLLLKLVVLPLLSVNFILDSLISLGLAKSAIPIAVWRHLVTQILIFQEDKFETVVIYFLYRKGHWVKGWKAIHQCDL